MSQIRKIATAGGTFAVALGIGFVMQNGDALAARMGGEATPVGAAQPAAPMASASAPAGPSMQAPLASAVALASPPIAVLVATSTMQHNLLMPLQTAPQPDTALAISVPEDIAAPSMPALPLELVALEADEVVDEVPGPGDAPSAEPACTVSLDGMPGPAATVTLTLAAPCSPGVVATIHHQGMIFSVPTSPEGTATFAVPALDESAVFIADVNGIDGAVAVVTVPDFAMYDRAVLQWQGETGLQLHALEFGAGYSDEGHLWNASMSTVDAALGGTGGYMMRLGDPGLADGHVAEVYSYPTAMSERDGQVVLSVEAEVTEANCGQAITAQSIQIHPGAEPSALDLTMVVPECDAIGEFLVLNNMLEDLTLVAR